MEFKNSKREGLFNNFWNNNIVFSDKKIRDHLLERAVFFPPVAEVNTWIKFYLEAVTSLINNIERMCVEYTDQDYVRSYIKASVQAASEDFLFYKLKMNQKTWDLTPMESLIEKAHPLLQNALKSTDAPESDPCLSGTGLK